MLTCMHKKVKIESNSRQTSMWITCMKKKAKFKSYSIQNVMMVTCMQKRVKNKSLQNAMEVTCKQKLEYKVQVITEHMVITCMQRRWKFNSTPGRSRGPSQMCPQVTFSVWISELIFSRAKSDILSLSLTAANWGKFLKHWHAFEVSLSFFWNNSNVFS